MKKMIALCLCVAVFCISGAAYGQADLNARFQAMAELEGVVHVKNDGQGNLISFMVVGIGQVRRSLPKQKAKRIARKEAARNARNEVSKFFNTSVKWQENAEGEMVCRTTGSASGDDGAATSMEESVATDVSSEKSSQCSEAALSGLRNVWSGFSADGEVVMIYGWKFSDVAALVNASKVMGAAARETVNQAKAVEGARMQDPNAAYQKEEAKDAGYQQAVPLQQAAPVQYAPQPGNNQAPVRQSSAASDAGDFF